VSEARILEPDHFKLGVFCLNVSGGAAMTSAEGTLKPTWAENEAVARVADEAGWEFLLSLGRWRGLGGSHHEATSFEVFTWAAGLAAVTEQIHVISTAHVPVFHPLLVAKQGATIDHISSGRFGLNVVAGWNGSELDMFGVNQLEHDERYLAASEWLEIVTGLWRSGEGFDFAGRYYSIKDGVALPQPLQSRPLIVNAGMSDTGMRFGAKYADISFQSYPDLEELARRNQRLRGIAATEFGRELTIISHGYVVCRDTEQEARDYFNYYVEQKGDWDAAARLVEDMIHGGSQSISPEARRGMQRGFIAGWAGMPLIGTPEQIVDGLLAIRAAGTNGMALHWVNFEDGIGRFNEQVLPLMESAGLRRPRNA
jgi:dimethylsulfone monooxygenase